MKKNERRAVEAIGRFFQGKRRLSRYEAAAAKGGAVRAERVRPLLSAWLERFEIENDSTGGPANTIHVGQRMHSIGAVEALAFRSGLAARTLWRIASAPEGHPDRAEFVTVESLDRLLDAIGLDYLLRFDPDPDGDGTDGFADVYFHPAVVGEAA